MGLEIERRFLVPDFRRLPPLGAPTRITQSFLSVNPVVRVRIESSGGPVPPLDGASAEAAPPVDDTGHSTVGGVTTRLKATLTIKGSAPTAGQSDEAKRTEAALSRCELEYPIPVAEARSLERLSPWPPIVKDRYRVERFELDRFHGAFEGLWIAEIELTSTHELVTIPDWCGPEVTHDVAWSNAELARTQRLADR